MGESGVGNLFDLLPEHIVDLILSKAIPTSKDAIRLSRVSKQFFNLLRNRSALTLETHVSSEYWSWCHCRGKLVCYNFEEYQKQVRELRYLCSTLKRYHEENIHLDTLKIHFRGQLFESDARDMDECMKLAAKMRLTSLDLSHNYRIEGFPEAFLRVGSLVELRLEGCSLPPAESLTVRLPILRKLQLYSVSMSNEGVLQNIIKGCPSIETLSICSCYLDNQGSNFKVSNLPNLKTLIINGFGDHENELTIEVRASAAARVEHLKCRHPVDLGEHEYPNLKILDLHKAKIVNAGKFFINFAIKFPRLERITLGHTLGTGRVHLLSPTLREIRLFGKYQTLEEAYFDVPNIFSFEYSQYELSGVPKLHFASGYCIVQIELAGCTDDIQGSWFSKQKQFLSQLNMPFEASIRVIFQENVFSNEAHWLNALSDLSFPPYGIIIGIQKFTIVSNWSQFSLSFVRAMMDAILLNYRPQTIEIFYNWTYWVGDKLEQNVKYTWDATNSADIIELLKPHENEKGFAAVFYLA